MLEICLISFLVISITVSIFFLLAFTIAQRADRSSEGTDKHLYEHPSEGKVHSKRSIPSVDF